MVTKILSSTLMLASVAAFAQQVVKGEVHDSDGKVVPNVTVSVENSSVTAVTDENGKFSIELPSGKNTLSFSSNNYNLFRRTISENTPYVYVTLEEGTKEISELVISAHKKLEVNKLNIKNLDAPMTVNVLNNAVLQKWDVNTFDEAAHLVTGLHSYKQYGAFQGFTIRGFNDFVVLYDGVRDERHSYFTVAPMSNLANIERMEVLKGPSGDMFGHSALGGILNVVRKKPTYTTHGDAKFTIGSYNTYNAALGIGGPISDKLRYRIDASTLNSDGYLGVKDKYNNVSVMLHYTPDERNKFEVYYQYADNFFGPNTGIPATDDGKVLYSWINAKANYANPVDYLKQKTHEFYVKYQHRFLNNSHIDFKVSYNDDDYDYLMDEVLFVDNANQKIFRANYGGYHFNRKNKSLVGQLEYNFKFNTFGIKHKAIVGHTLSHLDKPNYFGNITVVGADNDIVNGSIGEKKLTIAKKQLMNEFAAAVYVQDWIEFTDRLKLLGGVRYDYVSGDYGKRGAVNDVLSYEETFVNNVTYRGAVSFQPIKDFLTTYVSGSTFFKPTRQHDHKSGTVFEPERGHQLEGGIKIEKKNRVNATISGFYIEKRNLIVGHNILSQVGKAISRGFEIDADAEITKGLYLKAGYAYTDAFFAKQVVEQGATDISHNPTPWTPKHAANAWVNYEPTFVKGLGIGLGVFYTDKTYQNQLAYQYLPAYTIFNGTIYFQAKNNVRIGLNVENIFNKTYYTSSLSANDLWNADDVYPHPTMATMQMYPGRDRNYKLTISYSF